MILPETNVGMAVQDQRNVGLCASISLGYFGLTHGSTQGSDFGDLLRSQELFEASDAADVDGVLSIGSIVHPFQVRNNVVGFVPINVVDHRQLFGIGDKRDGNKSVNVDRLGLSISEEIDVSVSEFVRAWPENYPINASGLKSVANAIKASDLAEIADFIEVAEIRDRNGSPFFCESDIHSTGCPSGNSGSTIKGPSRAATYGGPAIMAFGSATYNRSHVNAD